MKKILIIFLLVLVIITGSCKKKTHNHKDQNHDCICDDCKEQLDHHFTSGVCDVCGTDEIDKDKIVEGTYVISSAKLGDEDCTKDFTIYKVTFSKDLKIVVSIYKNGLLSKREGTYEKLGSVIYETSDSNTYTYTIAGQHLFTTYDDLGDEIEIVLSLELDDVVNEYVDFEGVLFGQDVSLTKMYNYCPAIIYDTDDLGNPLMHIWYCTNKDSGVIVDYIGYRTATQREDGKWKFSEEEIVLKPSENTWDGYHTCDPSVVKGEFGYKGETYNYLMAYLGCVTTDYQKNETGIAVAKEAKGPWIKIDEANPIVPWYDDGDINVEEAKYQSYFGTSSIYWGTGMPSLVSIDGKGEVLMFYSSTYRGVGVRRINLSDCSNPVVKYTKSLSSKDVLNSVNGNGRIAIPDFAFDKTTNRFYVTGVTNEKNPSDITLTRVNSHSFVAYIENVNSMEEVSSILESGSYSWKMLGFIGPNETSWERNHNPGIVKDAYGLIPNSKKIQVIVSTGHNSWANENIFTYRLFGWSFDV